MDPTPGQINAVRLLARHWCRHPLACDSEEAIAQWWVDMDANVSPFDLRRALALLVEWEAIEVLAASDGRVRYRRRADCDPDALRRIAGGEVAPPSDRHNTAR